MLLGVPVIATGWSGNADFINARTGFPVRYRLRKIVEGEYPWAAGEWAEPDVDHAATLMRRLYKQGGAEPALVNTARSTVTKLFSPAAISRRLRNHLKGLQKQHKFA
jgi:hypothetical protein